MQHMQPFLNERQLSRLLDLQRDGRLSATQQAIVRAHLDAYPAHADWWEHATSFDQSLVQSFAAPLRSGIAPQVAARIRTRMLRPAARGPRLLPLALALLVMLASGSLSLLGGLLFTAFASGQSPPTVPPMASSTPCPQLIWPEATIVAYPAIGATTLACLPTPTRSPSAVQATVASDLTAWAATATAFLPTAEASLTASSSPYPAPSVPTATPALTSTADSSPYPGPSQPTGSATIVPPPLPPLPPLLPPLPSATPTASPLPTAEPSATVGAEPSATPTAEPSATVGVEPSATPTAAPSATATDRPEPEPEPEPTAAPPTSEPPPVEASSAPEPTSEPPPVEPSSAPSSEADPTSAPEPPSMPAPPDGGPPPLPPGPPGGPRPPEPPPLPTQSSGYPTP